MRIVKNPSRRYFPDSINRGIGRIYRSDWIIRREDTNDADKDMSLKKNDSKAFLKRN